MGIFIKGFKIGNVVKKYFVDDTLTEADYPPSAKKVGDEITDLKSDLSDVTNYTYVNRPPTSQGGFSKDGTLNTVNSKRIRTELIPIQIGDKIVIHGGSLGHACGIWNGTPSTATNVRNDNSFYYQDETIISEVNGYIVIDFAKTDSTQDVSLSEFDGYIHLYTNAIYRNSVKINELETGLDSVQNDLDDISGNVSDLELDVFGESTTVFTSETWQATAGSTVATAQHPCAVDIPANTEVIIKAVAPDGVFKNPIAFYTYNESLTEVDSLYNKRANTEFTYTPSQNIKRINMYVLADNVVGSGDFYFTVSFVETRSDSLKTQVDETASKVDAINDRFIQSKNVANDVVWILGDYDSDTAVLRPGRAGHIAHETYVPVDSETYYTVSWERSGGQWAYFCYYDSEKTCVSSPSSVLMANRKITIQTPENTAYLRICLWKSGETFESLVPTNFQIEKGHSATSYHAPIVLDSDSIDVEGVYNKMAEDGLFYAKASVPDYYYTNSYLGNKISRINTLAKSCAATGDSFIFITDEHWTLNQKQSIPLISAINNSCHIDKVISGGDTGNSPSEDFCNQLRKAFPHRIYHVSGNHDWFPEDGNLMYYYMDAYNVDQIGNPENHYYYVDNPQKKIRYIVLNRFKKANNEWINMNNDATQISWLTNEALNVENGWSVLVFDHYILKSDGVALALDGAKTNGVDVIAIIVGHTHYDMIRHTDGGIPMIYTTCDKNGAWISGGVDQEPWLTEDRPSGTIYEQAFDVFVVDRVNKTITAVRIGMPAMDNVDIAEDSTGWTYHGTLEERVITYT